MGFPTRSAGNIREGISKHFSLEKIDYVPVVVKERAMDLLLPERQLLLLSIVMHSFLMIYNNGFRRVRFRMILRVGNIRLAGYCWMKRPESDKLNMKPPYPPGEMFLA